MGLDHEILDSGCCGMAGAFGFEEGDKYEVSIQCGERALLPKVRSAPKDALIVADGFSCREQIEQTTDRRALHLAEVVRLGIEHGPAGPVGDYPERACLPAPGDVHRMRPATALAIAALPALLAWGGRRAARQRARRRRWGVTAAAGAALAAIGLVRAARRLYSGLDFGS
jgi:hypothetical protein